MNPGDFLLPGFFLKSELRYRLPKGGCKLQVEAVGTAGQTAVEIKKSSRSDASMPTVASRPVPQV